MSRASNLEGFMSEVKRRHPHETEFHQAVYEVAANVLDVVADNADYGDCRVLERLTEPDRIVIFRVCWQDDDNRLRINRGFRVQHSNAIGPYKGGLRFHPSVNQSILKFLAFEQTFKNSLTGLPMGGAKGGADFDPKGKSDGEVMRFCQAFMTELHRHIGAETDVPAGDIGVGSREIGYLFGQWVRLTNRFTGALTGKDIAYGGSPIRREATGYGAVYMLRHMLERVGEDIDGRTCLVSGAGNVALYAMEKLIALGGRVVTFSDSTGFVHDPEGVDEERWEYLVDLKTRRRGSVETYADEFGAEFHPGEKPWSVKGELALPCATQNEICCDDARTLIDNGVRAVSEGANMPTEQHGIADFIRARVLFAPSKAANAGGVALSGMEMSQNSAGETWKQETLERRLEEIMKSIHGQCLEYGCDEDGYVDYVRGANVAGFVKVADALVAYGVV